MKFFPVVRSCISYLFWAPISLIVILLVYPMAFLPASIRHDNRLYFWLTSRWNWLLFKTAGVSLRVQNREALPRYPERPSIIVANHASAFDIFVIEELLGGYPRVWMSKDAYVKIPFFGTLLRRMHVPLSYGSVYHGARALGRFRRLVQGGTRHACIFPEGGRFTDGSIHPFLGGFAVLARKLQRPVVPVYIKDAYKVMQPNSIVIDNSHPLEVVVGPAFTLGADENNEAFSERVRAWFMVQND